MNRDHALFTLIGLLLGFIAGYVSHEMMAARQPTRAVHGGQAAPMAAGTAPTPAAGQAPMEEIARLSEYVANNPDDAEAALLLANLNYDIQNWARAVELYERYLELEPTDADVMTDLGVAYRQMGRPQDALGQFDRAQELVEGHWQSRFNEVVVLAFDLQRIDDALALVEELRQLQPGNADVERLAAEVEKRQAAS